MLLLLHFRLNPVFLLLFFFVFISIAHVNSLFHYDHHPTHVRRELVDEGKLNGISGLNIRRFIAELTETNNFILAETRTNRKDPTNNFDIYTGGWNISNEHYWNSVAFTAFPLFVIAAVWFVAFGFCLSLICLCYCCFRRKSYGYSPAANAVSLILLILFTISAMVGCAVLYSGQGKFHMETTDTLHYIVKQADNTFDSLRKVSDYLSIAKKIGVDSFSLVSDLKNKIDDIRAKINSTVKTLSDQTRDNSKKIENGLDTAGLVLVIVAAVMLLLALLGFLFSISGLQCLVHFFVVLGWILVAITFVLCGVFLLLHNVVADTCVAMDEWVQHPMAHTALDDILPCVDKATAQETLLRTKDVTYNLVNVVNSVITNVTNVDYHPDAGPLFFNQTGPLMPLVCNPLNSDFTDRKCVSGEVELADAQQEWETHLCKVSSSGICTTQGRVTPDIYKQMTQATNVSYGLNHFAPFLVDLADCTFARQTFTYIEDSYCPGLRRYSSMVYIGLVIVSGAVMLSLIFWVIYARERRHRSYTKASQGRFVQMRSPWLYFP